MIVFLGALFIIVAAIFAVLSGDRRLAVYSALAAVVWLFVSFAVFHATL